MEVTAQIYLADQRGLTETSTRRTLHTLNDEGYKAEGRDAIGSLRLFNEVSLLAGADWPLPGSETSCVVLLPVAGGLIYQKDAEEQFLEPGQVGLFSVSERQPFIISNPYEAETITFLQFSLSLPATGADSLPHDQINPLDLTKRNTLQSLLETPMGRGLLGRFDGRSEGLYGVDAPGTVLFVFVLQGVFEVANRLLHTGDSLSLNYPASGEMDFEALSPDAMLLLLDLR
jgi:quercetin 2,3-dioxygenase